MIWIEKDCRDKAYDDEIFTSGFGSALGAEPNTKTNKDGKRLGAERRENSCGREMQRRSFSKQDRSPTEEAMVSETMRCAFESHRAYEFKMTLSFAYAVKHLLVTEENRVRAPETTTGLSFNGTGHCAIRQPAD